MITWLIQLARGRSWLLGIVSSLAVLAGGMALFQPTPAKVVDTTGWDLEQFLEHLKTHGVTLHMRVMLRTGPTSQVILSEDPELTWESIQCKVVAVERIHQWWGTVSVWQMHPDMEMHDQVAAWGQNGCQIGDFVLFGDERVLQQIKEAFGH